MQKSSPARRKTALVGFGKIAQGYSRDKLLTEHMQYASHAQVLSVHPAYHWVAVVDSSPAALEIARAEYPSLECKASCAELVAPDQIEVLVLATPPDNRLSDLKIFANLRAVIVEKPLGVDFAASREFIEYCRKKNIKVQVNLLRRADALTGALAQGRLTELIGPVQCATGLYGNGLKNNGLHMVDLVRMLLGAVTEVRALPGLAFAEGPITGDINLPFVLTLASGQTVFFSPVKFSGYRENCLEITGLKGKLQYLHGGLTVQNIPVTLSRMGGGENELDYQHPETLESTLGQAFYQIYDNLASALTTGTELLSEAESALISTKVVQAILDSAKDGYRAKSVLDERVEIA